MSNTESSVPTSSPVRPRDAAFPDPFRCCRRKYVLATSVSLRGGGKKEKIKNSTKYLFFKENRA